MTYWVNVYEEQEGFIQWPSQEEADVFAKVCSLKRIYRIKITLKGEV